MHRPAGRTLSDLGCRRLGRRGERDTGPAHEGLGLLLVLVLVSTLLYRAAEKERPQLPATCDYLLILV